MKLHYISSASIWKPLDIFKWWGGGIEIVVQLYQNISFLRVTPNSRYWFIPITSSLSLLKNIKRSHFKSFVLLPSAYKKEVWDSKNL